MTKRSYSILQARLRELESKLNDALLLPLSEDYDQSHHSSLSEDIKQKTTFIKNLLSAEIATSPPSKLPHLQHMAQRLAKLEDTLLNWDSFGPFSIEDFDRGSNCSCTESCFNDDGEGIDEAAAMAGFADPEKVSEGGFVGEKAMVEWEGGETDDDGEKEREKVKRVGFRELGSIVYEDAEDHFLEGFENGGLVRKRKSEFGKICGAMGGGVMVGMVLMGFLMLRFSGCFEYFMEQEFLTIPT